MDAAQHALPAEGVILQLVVLHQLFHDVVGSGILLQAHVLLHGGKGFLVAGAVHRGGEGIVAGGVRLADEQSVVPALTVGFQQLHDALQHPVKVFVAHQQLVQDDIIAGGAGGDAAAGAVHDVAARRRDREVIVGGIGGLRLEAVAVYQLQEDETHHIQPHHHRADGDEGHHPTCHRFVFVRVHSFSFRHGGSDHTVVDLEFFADPLCPTEGQP